MLSFTQQVQQWARKQPADKPYDYNQPCGCALFQFLDENGMQPRNVGAYHWQDFSGKTHWFDERNKLSRAGLADALMSRPHTFGALADRLSA